MSSATPTFPKTLTAAAWRNGTKKENLADAGGDVEDAVAAFEKKLAKVEWADFEAGKKNAAEFKKVFSAALDNLAAAEKALGEISKTIARAKALKESKTAEETADAAEDALSDLVNFRKAAQENYNESLEKLKTNENEEDADSDEDDDEEDDGGDGYRLKPWLRKVRKMKDKGLMFAFAKCSTSTNTKLKYQLFLDKKKLSKQKVKNLFGGEYEISKVLAIGRVISSDGAFVFQSKQPPPAIWEKIFTKILKIQFCLTLGVPALGQLSKDDPEFNSPEDDLVDSDDGIAAGFLDDSGDAKDSPNKDAAPDKELEKKLAQVVAQVTKAGITDKEKKGALASLIRSAQEEIAAAKNTQAEKTLRAIVELLKAAPAAGSAAFDKEWKKALETYRDTLETVSAQVAALGKKLAKEENPELQRIAKFGFGAITKNLNVPLRAALLDISALAAGEQRTRHAKKAVTLAQNFVKHLQSDKMVYACDENPFGIKVTIRDSLIPVLENLQKTLAKA